MALTHPGRPTTSGKWSCRRCYTVNAVGAQFCTDCGLAPRPGPAAAAPPSTDLSRGRLLAVPFILIAVCAIGLLGLQLIR